MSTHDLLTLAETADYLRVSRRTITRWISGGRLNAQKAGARVLVRRAEVERFLAGGGR